MSELPDIFYENCGGDVYLKAVYSTDKYGQVYKNFAHINYGGCCFVGFIMHDSGQSSCVCVRSVMCENDSDFYAKIGTSTTWVKGQTPDINCGLWEQESLYQLSVTMDGGYIEGFSDIFNELTSRYKIQVKILNYMFDGSSSDRYIVNSNDEWETSLNVQGGMFALSSGFSVNIHMGEGFTHGICPNDDIMLYLNGDYTKITGGKQYIDYLISELLYGLGDRYYDFVRPRSDYLYADWKIYLNGNKPLITVNAESGGIGYEKEGQFLPEDVQCIFEATTLTGTGKKTFDCMYQKLPYDTSYNELLSGTDENLFYKLINGIGDWLNFSKITLKMYCKYVYTDQSGVKHPMRSDCMYVDIPPKLPDFPSEINTGRQSRNDASTIEVIFGAMDSGDDDYTKQGDNDDPDDPYDPDNPDAIKKGVGTSAHSLLTKSYVLTKETCKLLGNSLWGDSFFDNIQLLNNSPIENIVGCKIFPFQVSGTNKEIVIGNVGMNIYAPEVANSYNYKHEIGSLNISKKYNSFLDYAPFTKLTVYLPYCGFKELDCAQFMGKKLTVEMIADIVTGTCKYILYCETVPVMDFDGVMGIDIPVTASNRAQVEAGIVSGAVSGVMATAMGNPIGGVTSALLNSAMVQNHSSSTSVSSACASYNSPDVYIIYNRPTYQDLNAFNHTKGRMCNLSKQIGGLSGFTKTSETVDTSGIQCTDEERTEIVQILSSGFFV